MTSTSDNVDDHYARHGNLAGRILSALSEAGNDITALSADDLSMIDQFHLRGHQATEELVELLQPRSGARVLDIGCGVGGPARMLAAHRNCDVTGLDLTEVFCATGAALSATVGLSAKTRFVCGNALSLPFSDNVYDIAWTQHTAMNISDKSKLYQEIARTLKPGGRLGLYDIVAGVKDDLHFPVPWASKPEGSHLVPARAIQAALSAAGLREVLWHDLTDDARAWNKKRRAAIADSEGPPLLGPHLIMGPEFAEMIANIGRNLDEDRVAVIQAVYEKPA